MFPRSPRHLWHAAYPLPIPSDVEVFLDAWSKAAKFFCLDRSQASGRTPFSIRPFHKIVTDCYMQWFTNQGQLPLDTPTRLMCGALAGITSVCKCRKPLCFSKKAKSISYNMSGGERYVPPSSLFICSIVELMEPPGTCLILRCRLQLPANHPVALSTTIF